VYFIFIFRSIGTVNRGAIRHRRNKYKIFYIIIYQTYTLQQQQTTANRGWPTGLPETMWLDD